METAAAETRWKIQSSTQKHCKPFINGLGYQRENIKYEPHGNRNKMARLIQTFKDTKIIKIH